MDAGIQQRSSGRSTRAAAGGLDPARLHAAMRYAVLGGGKRVRPLLAFAAGELTGRRASVERSPSRSS
jgi:farnesyl diphosphate synthase